MGHRITITAGRISIEAELNDSASAEAIRRALPIQGEASTWGQEVYFEIGVEAPSAKDAREVMSVGDLAYWPPGRALCLFFGRTPASAADGRPRAASPVNPVGRILGEAKVLASIRDGQAINVRAKT